MSELEDGFYWVKWVSDINQEWDVMQRADGQWSYFADGVTDEDFSVIGPRIQPPEDE